MQNDLVVPRTGLEPARLSTLAPETSASTIPPPGLSTRIGALIKRAENEARTRDPNLGKVVLYQLSYFRNFLVLSQNRHKGTTSYRYLQQKRNIFL